MPVQGLKTRWGGIADGRFRPSGFFRIGECDGVFWLVDPDGGSFLSKGVNTVRFDQDRIQDSDRVPYAEAYQRKHGGESRTIAAVNAEAEDIRSAAAAVPHDERAEGNTR